MLMYASIIDQESGNHKKVKITASDKPVIERNTLKKWQFYIDLAARIAHVPSSLIIRVHQETLELLVTNKSSENPFLPGKQFPLNRGSFCETVIAKQQPLMIPDARQSEVWKEIPVVQERNLVSYLGYPLSWPDGEVFGTVCLADHQRRRFSNDIKKVLQQVKQQIETDLQLIFTVSVLEKKNKEQEVQNQVKNRFLILLAHDVRGKMGTLNNMLEESINNLESLTINDLRKVIRLCSESAHGSFQLFEDILKWAKDDLAQLEPVRRDVNVFDIIESQIHDYHNELTRKGIKVERHYRTRNETVFADVEMLKVVIRNLFSNAIKYSHVNGKIMFRVDRINDHILIELEDEGIGMDKKAVDNLFTYDPLHRKEGTAGESSAGIGLMLVKEFIKKHHAEIAVDSSPGKGTRCKIKWPKNAQGTGAPEQ